MDTVERKPEATPSQAEAEKLLQLIASLAGELRPSAGAQVQAGLDTRLDRDLGLDSLAMTELALRIERAFGISLPDETLLSETPRDLLRAVLAARGTQEQALSGEAPAEPAPVSVSSPVAATTLDEVLAWHAQRHPGRAHIHLYEQPDQCRVITYAALEQGAREVAHGLLAAGLEPGHAVAIMLPTCAGYFFSFFGVLLAGGVPVPMYPPARLSQIEEHLRRHSKILANAGARHLITVPEAMAVTRLLKAHVLGLRQILTVEELRKPGPRLRSGRGAQDIAFLQYTSGSTGDPKGVIMTHANLLTNIRALVERVEADSSDVFVSWLPLYHDMGLIGAWLGTLYLGAPLIVMSPLSFLARPSRWLWAIHRHRGTLTASPNFGYELCLRKIQDDEIRGLDLSSLRIGFNGAEPVSPDTITGFEERFAPYGLGERVLLPVYGLAEGTVGVAVPRPGRGMQVDRIQRERFLRDGYAEVASDEDPNPLLWVSCGEPLRGEEVRVVDDAGIEAPERREGRIEFRGPSATSGYFRNAEATGKLFRHEDWRDSGDRGYIAGGAVFVTGRDRDLIIRAGRNIYPYELDEAIGEIPGIRKGCVASFGSRRDTTGAERLVVVAETRETSADVRDRLRAEIVRTATDILGIAPDEVVLVPPRSVLKTSSGKIRRSATQRLYEQGTLGRAQRRAWWQLLRLAVSGAAPLLRRVLRTVADTFFSCYAWVLFLLIAPVGWLLVVILPRRAWRWALLRAAAGFLRRATGTAIKVEGLEHIPQGRACVIAANHASYLDAMAMTVALPQPLTYVAKKELESQPLARLFLRRLGTLFVERFDVQKSREDVQQLARALGEGETLAIFPEGTFTRVPGLAPFHLGGFLAAAQAGVPVVPVALSGTRSILRSGAWWIRPSAVRVSVGQPVYAESADWAAATRLMRAAREAILERCGEPDLAA